MPEAQGGVNFSRTARIRSQVGLFLQSWQAGVPATSAHKKGEPPIHATP